MPHVSDDDESGDDGSKGGRRCARLACVTTQLRLLRARPARLRAHVRAVGRGGAHAAHWVWYQSFCAPTVRWSAGGRQAQQAADTSGQRIGGVGKQRKRTGSSITASKFKR